MTYFSSENKTLVLKSNKKTVMVTVLTFFAGALAITAILLLRDNLGRIFSQIAVTLVFAFMCSFALAAFQSISANNKILSLFDTMLCGSEKTVEGTFEKEDHTITKNGLLFRQLYFTAKEGSMRLLVFEKTDIPDLVTGQTVTLKIVGNVVKERL